jgi:hypothetical protein
MKWKLQLFCHIALLCTVLQARQRFRHANNIYLVISTKGRAFLSKGGYTAIRNKERIKYGLSYLSGVVCAIVAWFLAQCSY